MSTLEKMPGHTRLYRRNATYYHRAVVPTDIADSYPKREETFSLKTKDYGEALRLVRIKAVEVDQRFEAHRRMLRTEQGPVLEELTRDQIRQISDIYYAHILDEDDDIRMEGFGDSPRGAPEEGEAILRPPHRKTFEEHSEDSTASLEINKYLYARGGIDEFFLSEAEEVLTWDNVELRLSLRSPSWPLLCRSLQEATVRARQAILERNQGEIVPTPIIEAKPITPAVSEFPLFSEAVSKFIAEHKTSGWTDKTSRDYAAWLRNFQDVVGDRPLDSYSKKDGRAFKSLLSILPANWNKKPTIKLLTITEAATKANELGLPPMAPENANKAMGRVSAFWKWVDANYFDANGPAPLTGMKFKTKETASQKRLPYSVSQLNAIFSSPIYTGFHSHRNWKTDGVQLDAAHSRFWLPLLGLFTGAREAELFGLSPNDIVCEGEIYLLQIAANDETGTRLKTRSSERRIPIHSQLISLGFLDLCAQRKREGHSSLFYDCEAKSPEVAADNFSKWYARFATECNVKTPKHVFHSFRHNLEDALGNGNVQEPVINALQGHQQLGMRAIYGSGKFDAVLLKEAIESVRYSGLKLDFIGGYQL